MLMNSFQVPIYNYIRRLVVSHEDAEDVLQEVFILSLIHIQMCIRDRAITNPTRTIFSIKRFMGENWDQVQKEVTRVPYKVCLLYTSRCV